MLCAYIASRVIHLCTLFFLVLSNEPTDGRITATGQRVSRADSSATATVTRVDSSQTATA